MNIHVLWTLLVRPNYTKVCYKVTGPSLFLSLSSCPAHSINWYNHDIRTYLCTRGSLPWLGLLFIINHFYSKIQRYRKWSSKSFHWIFGEFWLGPELFLIFLLLFVLLFCHHYHGRHRHHQHSTALVRKVAPALPACYYGKTVRCDHQRRKSPESFILCCVVSSSFTRLLRLLKNKFICSANHC